MLERCPHSPAAGTGWLNGWRLTFGGEDLGWDGALPMVVPDTDSQVFVALYDMSPQDMRTLDYWEGADTGLYNKIRLRISTLDGDVAGLGLHPRRVRGRAAVGAHDRADRRRGPGRRRAGRVRRRTARPPVPLAGRVAAAVRSVF